MLPSVRAQGAADHPQGRWYESALAMRKLAESWGDQAYGAVLVQGNRIIGHGPSRVIRNSDPEAHAEREALRDAVAAVGAAAVRGAVLYSTSRPCPVCERAAAQAGVARMYFGPALQDAGIPGGGGAVGPREHPAYHRPGGPFTSSLLDTPPRP